MTDVKHFNITISAKVVKLVTSGDTMTPKYSNSLEWELNSSWTVKLICYWKQTITFEPSNGAVTKGSWECKYSMSHSDHCLWKKAHVYENEYGYLIHEIVSENNCNQNYPTYNISCKKTNGEFFRCKVCYYIACIDIMYK